MVLITSVPLRCPDCNDTVRHDVGTDGSRFFYECLRCHTETTAEKNAECDPVKAFEKATTKE